MDYSLETSTALEPRLIPSEKDVALARQAFFEQGRIPAQPVHRRIVSSWQRCVQLGMDADERIRPAPVDQSALREAFARNEALRLLAEPEIEFLTETLADTASQVILSDAQGLILDTRGNQAAMNRAIRESLLPGVSWAERQMGTNAIGTALAENHLVEIWGAEHFHLQLRKICCTAAPILDHTGAIVGLLDVSGDSRLPRGYARSVVKRAVREIEHRWLLNAPEHFTRLHLHPTRACMGSYQEGVLLLEDERIVGASRSALRWLETDWRVIGRDLHTLFDLSVAPADFSLLRCHDGRILHGSLQRAPQRMVRTPAPAQSTARQSIVATLPAATWLSRTHENRLEQARRVVDAGLSIVLSGETGAGKEVFARLVHAHSTRADGPFVAINCAALPESLIEAELFGYSEGAFTGARRKGAPGRILEANGGILFLDEIGDMPLLLQARLLRVLQDRQVVPLGGGPARPVDCVVVSATHKNLDKLIAADQFRADLYFRLRDHQVDLPAFRELAPAERKHAIEQLWQASGAGKKAMRLSQEAAEALHAYAWPGNLRQVASVLRTLVALGEPGQCFGLDALPEEIIQRPATGSPQHQALKTINDEAILAALRRHNGKVAAAARELGMHRATVYRKLNQLKASKSG